MLTQKSKNLRVSALGRVRKRLFGLSPAEATFARRGFRARHNETQRRLERIGHIFLQGYHAALEETNFAELARRLNSLDAEFRGFAFEGAAMGLSLLDCLTLWKKDRWSQFASEFGSSHIYMMHVGIGWSFARLRRRLTPQLARLDSLLGWLAIDGYGFHQGYFHWQRYIERQETPHDLCGYAQRVFDQGIGRSIWFVRGANVREISEVVAAFPETRRADLWAGLGLACAYAGGAAQSDLEMLCRSAGLYRGELAQGAAFAAKTRQRAGNPVIHTEIACRVLCDLSADEAAEITDLCLENLPHGDELPAYEIWRQRIRIKIAQEVSSVCHYV